MEDLNQELQTTTEQTPVVEEQQTQESEVSSIEDVKNKVSEEVQEESVETAQPEEYVPNYKFNVASKEYEIPEKFRALMKSKEDEAELKDLFTKAQGLDYIKNREATIKQENEYFKTKVIPEYQKQDAIINELSEYVKRDDFDSYFERLGIDPKRLEQWMYKRLSLTPEQRDLYNQTRELQKQAYQAQMETEHWKGQAQTISQAQEEQHLKNVLQQLDFTLNKSENKGMVDSFDAINGAGSFQRKVIEYAAFLRQTQGVDLTPEQAVEKYKELAYPKGSGVVSKVQAGVPKDKPVLPMIKSKPHSPTAKQITSIQQIREKAQALAESRMEE